MSHSGNLKRCPYCAEYIQEAAVVCRFCNRDQPKESDISKERTLAEDIGYYVGLLIASLVKSIRYIAGILIARYGLKKSLLVIVLLWIVCVVFISIQHNKTTKIQTKTTTTSPAVTIPTPVSTEKYAIVLGTPADSVLVRRGKANSTTQVGSDNQGLLVEWHYSDVIYLMGRRIQDGIEVYRVIEIKPGKPIIPTGKTGKYDPIAKYGKEKVDSANKVMDLVKQDCNVFIDGGLVVEMSYYVNDKNVLLGYVTAIANADAILFGSARSIFVYDPSKKMIASADSFRGIRLRD